MTYNVFGGTLNLAQLNSTRSVLTRLDSEASSDSNNTDQSLHTHCSGHDCRQLTRGSHHICIWTHTHAHHHFIGQFLHDPGLISTPFPSTTLPTNLLDTVFTFVQDMSHARDWYFIYHQTGTEKYVQLSNVQVSKQTCITFCIKRSRGEMYIDHARLSVCLSVPLHIPTLQHGPVGN